MEFLDINGLKILISEIKSYIKEKAIIPLSQKVDKAKFKNIIGADPDSDSDNINYDPAWSIGSGDSLLKSINQLDKNNRDTSTTLGVDLGQKIKTSNQYQIKGSHTIKSAIDTIDVSLEDLKNLIKDESSSLKNKIDNITCSADSPDYSDIWVGDFQKFTNLVLSNDLDLNNRIDQLEGQVDQLEGQVDQNVEGTKILLGDNDMGKEVRFVNNKFYLATPGNEHPIEDDEMYFTTKRVCIDAASNEYGNAIVGKFPKYSDLNNKVSNIETAVNVQGETINNAKNEFAKIVKVNLGDMTYKQSGRGGYITEEEYNAIMDPTYPNKIISITGEINIDKEIMLSQGVSLTGGDETIAYVNALSEFTVGAGFIQAPWIIPSGGYGLFIGNISFYKEGDEYTWKSTLGGVKMF